MTEYTDAQRHILGRLETCARWLTETRDMVDHALRERTGLILEAQRANIAMVDIARAAHIARETAHRIVGLNS